MKNMKRLVLGFAIVLTGILSSSARAQLVNFDFSFTTTDGPVTGELVGLNSTGISAPTEVIIDSAPSSVDITTPLDLSSVVGTVTVSGSSLTLDAGNLSASTPDHQIVLNLTPTGNSLANNAGAEVFNSEAPTFNLDSAPEPSTYAMLLGGLSLLAFWRLRTRRTPVNSRS